MADPIITKIGDVSAYLDAVAHGFRGTRAEFGELLAHSANYAQSAANSATSASASAATATTKANEATTAAAAAQTAKTQTEQAASQALTDIDTASSGAISAVRTEGATQTANATAQARAAATSANTASTKASEASASATTATTKATEAAASATSAANAASAAQGVLESIPEDYSDLSEDVDQLKADLESFYFEFANEGTFELATINVQTGEIRDATNRITLTDFIAVDDIKKLSTNANYSLNLFGYGDANVSSYIGSTSWTFAGTVYDKKTIRNRLPSAKYIRFVFKEKNESVLTLEDITSSEFSLILAISEKVNRNSEKVNRNEANILANTESINELNGSVGKILNVPYQIGSLNQIARLGWMPYAMNMPPEQSIYSYQLAYEKGCRLMLCDLRKTSDGTFVCWHDADLGAENSTNVVKHTDGTNLTSEEKAQTITSTSIETLDTYDFGLYKGSAYAGLKILRFEDFVKFCGKLNCILVVETKYQMDETDVQSACKIIKQNNLGDRVIIAEDVTYYPYTHKYWKNNLHKMIINIRGGSRAYSSAILQAKQCVDNGFESVISFTSTSGITNEMIADMVDYGISMWFSEITSESALETFETDGWLNKFKYISSSYAQISKYAQTF